MWFLSPPPPPPPPPPPSPLVPTVIAVAACWLVPALCFWLFAKRGAPLPAPQRPKPAHGAGVNAGAAPKSGAKAAVDDDSSSSDDEVSEESKDMWKRVDAVLQEFALSRLGMAAAHKWVRMLGDPKNEELSRLRQWMLMRINGKRRASPPSPWQAGCPEIFAGLRAKPLWDAKDVPWLRTFEEHFAEIRDELLALRSQRGFQPLKLPNWASKTNTIASPDGSGAVSHDAGDWNVFYLNLHEVQFPENLARCPVTARLLLGLGPRSYSHAFFSALTPGTHIIKHHGPTNKKLRVHLPLVGAAGSELRVADQVHANVEGQCLMFDDSFEHEAWHRGDATRIVLVFDVWHPDLTDKVCEPSAPVGGARGVPGGCPQGRGRRSVRGGRV